MLTAHLPSGYVMARLWGRPAPWLMLAALIGAMVPDLDMLWFHLVDNASVHHHRYWPHIPLIWAGIAVVCTGILWRTQWRVAGLMFFAAIFLHLMLDTVTGGILWLYPVSSTLFRLVEVPAAYDHWVISFLLHWTFALELAVWLAALVLWVQRRNG